MHAIILIERYRPSSFFWPNLLKDKRIAHLSVEEILNKYQGFEGELISFLKLDKDKKKSKPIVDQYLESKKNENYLLLNVVSDFGENSSSFSEEQAVMVGYDVGVCDEEKTIYSSIFNEVLFGHLEELILYKDLLNEYLLFPSRILAMEYVSQHDTLSALGKSVEDYEPMTIYKVWKYKNGSPK